MASQPAEHPAVDSSSKKPSVLSPKLADIPADLKAPKQWVIWRLEKNDDGKWTKVPYRASSPQIGASHSDEKSWSTFPRAVGAYSNRDNNADGIGFVFSSKDEFTGIDLDKCRNPETGELTPFARDTIAKFNSYTEVSPSKTGVKIFIRGHLLKRSGRRKTEPPKIEIYTYLRFFAVTGEHLENTPTTIEWRQRELIEFFEQVFGPETAEDEAPGVKPNDQKPSHTTVADAEIIRRASLAHGEKFRRLWAGDTSEYNSDDSAADEALCSILAYWTSCDTNQIDRMFRASGLMRKKWQDRDDYRALTIGRAIALVKARIEGEKQARERIDALLKSKGKLKPQADRDAFEAAISDAAKISDADYQVYRRELAAKLNITSEFLDVERYQRRPRREEPPTNPATATPAPATEVERVIEEMNEKYFVVENFGSKCKVCWFDQEHYLPDFKGHQKLVHQAFNDFRDAQNEPVFIGKGKNGEDITRPRGELWLESPKRNQYEKIAFAPEQVLDSNILNLWRGFAYEPKEGDCSLYLDHVRDVICKGERAYFDYLIGWLAYAVQRPWERGHVAIVVRGRKGLGKNVFAETFSRLFGIHGLTVNHAEHLVGRFNAHLIGKCVMVCNEALYAGNHAHEATLKSLVTDPTFTFEKKFVDAEAQPNLLHIIILSNAEWVVPASEDERRYLVLDASDDHREDFEYFSRLQNQMENGGYEALLYHLRHFDLTGFNIRAVPRTGALRSQMIETLTGVDSVWFECLRRGEIPVETIENDGSALMRSAVLVEWATNQRRRDFHDVSATKLGILLGDHPRRNSMGFQKKQIRDAITNSTPQFWIIPPLEEARQLWNERRFLVDWGDDSAGWARAPERPGIERTASQIERLSSEVAAIKKRVFNDHQHSEEDDER